MHACAHIHAFHACVPGHTSVHPHAHEHAYLQEQPGQHPPAGARLSPQPAAPAEEWERQETLFLSIYPLLLLWLALLRPHNAIMLKFYIEFWGGRSPVLSPRWPEERDPLRGPGIF